VRPGFPVVVGALTLAALVAGCTGGVEGDTPGSSVATGSVGSTESAPTASSSSGGEVPDPVASAANAERLRASISRFESDLAEAGGVEFILKGPSNDADTVKLAPDGSQIRQWENKAGEAASVVTVVKEGSYSSKSSLDDVGVELMSAVSPEAEWMLEDFDRTTYVPLNPARVTQAILAYSTEVSCSSPEGAATCRITAAGMPAVPGLGGFESADGILEAIVALSDDGTLQSVEVFPEDDFLRLALSAFTFSKIDVRKPEGVVVSYQELIDEQARREAASSAEPNQE
jgi:hypothetical protein